jgi:hypothetical protein
MQIMSTIHNWQEGIISWYNVKIVDAESRRDNCIFEVGKDLTITEIGAILKNYSRHKYLKFSAQGTYQCFAQKNDAICKVSNPISVSFQTNEVLQNFGESLEIEGNYEIYFQRASPYVFINQTIANGVEQNLEDLMQLLLEITKLGAVEKFKVFSDNGDQLAFNAHLAFFRNENQVQEDLDFMHSIWEKGLENYKIPPLKTIDFNDSIFLTHEWRTEEMRQKLKNSMQKTFQDKKPFNLDKYKESNHFDIYKTEKGFMVLEFPYFMNAFLDTFYFF